MRPAKKSGRLIPADSAGEAQVLRWCFAAMNTVELPLMSLLVLDWTADGSCGKHGSNDSRRSKPAPHS